MKRLLTTLSLALSTPTLAVLSPARAKRCRGRTAAVAALTALVGKAAGRNNVSQPTVTRVTGPKTIQGLNKGSTTFPTTKSTSFQVAQSRYPANLVGPTTTTRNLRTAGMPFLTSSAGSADDLDPEEKKIKDDIEGERSLIESINTPIQQLQQNILKLPEVKLELIALIGTLSENDRKELENDVQSGDVFDALQLIDKRAQEAEGIISLMPKFKELKALLKAIDDSATELKSDMVKVQQQGLGLVQAVAIYIANDKAAGSLGVLGKELQTAVKSLEEAGKGIGAGLVKAEKSFVLFVQKSLKDKSYDGKDFDMFLGELSATVDEIVEVRAELENVETLSKEFVEKVEEITGAKGIMLEEARKELLEVI